jgi:hypothetical protein
MSTETVRAGTEAPPTEAMYAWGDEPPEVLSAKACVNGRSVDGDPIGGAND